jgi:hypothetical protein
MTSPHRITLAVYAGAFLSGCATPDTGQAQRRRALVDSTSVVPTGVIEIKLQARPELTENSTAAASASQPGIFFTINDAGNQPLLYAFDSTGADRGAWRVAGVRNIDWEAASVGPCAAGAERATASPASCVYIGEVGDNDAKRPARAIYRVAEPPAQGAGFVGSVTPATLVYRYPDQPHDVEAMYVAPNGDTFLITKRQLRNTARERRPALVFRLPAAAWTATAPVEATLIDSLPIIPGSAPKRQITDAALSADGRRLAVRTYREVYIFVTDSATGRVDGMVPPTVCNVTAFDRWQGEGVAWYGQRGALLLTSEGRDSPMHAVNCPLPSRQ